MLLRIKNVILARIDPNGTFEDRLLDKAVEIYQSSSVRYQSLLKKNKNPVMSPEQSRDDLFLPPRVIGHSFYLSLVHDSQLENNLLKPNNYFFSIFILFF